MSDFVVIDFPLQPIRNQYSYQVNSIDQSVVGIQDSIDQ